MAGARLGQARLVPLRLGPVFLASGCREGAVCGRAVAVSVLGTLRVVTRGTFEGVITLEPRGENGFGYDPYLHLPEDGRTSAELSPAEKNARSHRGAATRAMVPLLEAMSRD